MKWESYKVSELCNIVRGSSPRPQGDPRYYGGKVPRLMIEDITRDGMYVSPKTDSLTDAGALLSRPMKKGDLVITVSGRPGVPAILAIDACVHDGFVGFRDLKKEVNVKFLYRYLSFLTAKTNDKSVGAIFKNLTTEQIKNIDVPLPPLHIQVQIADTLDKADALRSNDQELLKKYDELAQSIFYEMFGDPFEGPRNSDNKINFGKLTNLITYGFTKPMKHFNRGIPILTAKNIQRGYIDYENVHFASQLEFDELTAKCKPLRGDILITKDGSIGRTALVETDETICINQSVALIKPNQLLAEPKFLVSYLNLYSVQEKIQNMGKGVGLKHLQITELAKFPISFPDIRLQRQFVQNLETLSEAKEKSELQKGFGNSLFESLLQKAFNE